MGKYRSAIYRTGAVILMGIILAYMFRLQLPYGLALMGVVGAALPFWIRQKQKREREEIRFMEVNLYMEQVVYSFRKSLKVLPALIDVEKLFVKGKMANCIEEAIAYIRETYEGEEILEKALSRIETEYPTRRIIYIHRLMCKVEHFGGDCEDSIRIILKNRAMWEKETISYQKQCQMQKRNISIAILLSCLLCLMTPVLCQTSLQSINILAHPVYQMSTFLLLSSAIIIYLYTEKFFARDWLQEKEEQEEKSNIRKYEKVMQYDFGKARRKSVYWTLLAVGITGTLALAGRRFAAIMCLPLVILMMFQHKIDYALAKKAVCHEIRKAFPNWLMEVSLLLQTENVAISLQKSMEQAPGILKPELRMLVEKLEVSPESNVPYSEFLQRFMIPEVTSAMGMLYSISDGGGSDARTQIEEILERNTRWQAEAEALSNQDKIGRMYVLFLLPALLGACKMVADMTLILIAFFMGMHG